MVEGGGFEPPKSLTTDLQSVPFGHSGTPPQTQILIRLILYNLLKTIQFSLQLELAMGLEPATS